MSITISKGTIKRLINDVKCINNNPLTDNGIHYIHDEEDMLKGYVLFIANKDTPYYGGYYFFELSFPPNYPYSPPKLTFCTNGNNIRFHPNYYKCGKVCLSLLNTWTGDQWTSCQTISSVLLTMSSLFTKDPLLHEPGVREDHPDFYKYNQIVQYFNIDVAMCDILLKKKGVYLPFFDKFTPIIEEYFLKNYVDIKKNVESNMLSNKDSPEEICTGIYRMTVTLDYIKLMSKMEQTYKTINNKK